MNFAVKIFYTKKKMKTAKDVKEDFSKKIN